MSGRRVGLFLLAISVMASEKSSGAPWKFRCSGWRDTAVVTAVETQPTALVLFQMKARVFGFHEPREDAVEIAFV